MNLPTFLREVDTLVSDLSRQNLEDFIHEMARTLPEGRREYFLTTLKGVHKRDMPRGTEKDGEYDDLRAVIEMIKKKLAEINDGERCLDSRYNEEWDEWYNIDDDQILFSDPERILDDIACAMGLIHRCVDMEAYKEGYELAEILSVLEVEVDGEYNEFNGRPLYLRELDGYGLLSYDYKKMVVECLYLAYMENDLADRPDAIFSMMNHFECFIYSDIGLEQVLQSGNNELPQFDGFLVQWIAYLGEQRGSFADRLLCEAQAMLSDEEAQIENARKYAAEHPSLCKQLLEQNLEIDKKSDLSGNERMLRLGMEFLDAIPSSQVLRSEIALLAAEYACKISDKEAMETCWLEAFRSNTTVTDYLRLRLRVENWTKYEDAVMAIYEQVYEETQGKRGRERLRYELDGVRENSLHKNEYCFLLFLEKQFDRVIQIGMNEKQALGWSGTFMKQGLALFLMLLYDGTDLPAGIRAMRNKAAFECGFKADEYVRGTGIHGEANDEDVFWELFCQWKRDVQISDKQRETWLRKIEKWIELRVAGIMDGNHRNYYGECASYIAAFGEVRESMGISGGKSRMMGKYKNEYSRRRAFHQELRNYGMEN